MSQEEVRKILSNGLIALFAGFIVAGLVVRLVFGLPVVLALPLLSVPSARGLLVGLLIGGGGLGLALCLVIGRAFGKQASLADPFGWGLAAAPLLEGLTRLSLFRSLAWLGVAFLAFYIGTAATFFVGFKQGRRQLAQQSENATAAM